MIHRVDRVNPDVDDRVIRPNEARMAMNLRFGASTDDTNLSGGSLVLGNAELPFTPPAGTNKIVGVYADLESRNVFFALYNGENNHGLYRINGATDVVEPIARGSWLRFQEGDDYNVSITVIDGKMYWTDNVNEPRVINIAKGIRTQFNLAGVDVYPSIIEDWHYTQIKRPPGQFLEVAPQVELVPQEVSLTKLNRAANSTGFQYSYYYVFDNFEESRLAPYSVNTYGNYNITLTIPQTEFNAYTSETSLIKAIVLVIRNGNDGVWRELRYVINDGVTRTFTFANILATSKSLVSSDITDARFDSVPFVSATNEIAQNKLNHANYIVDYPPIEGVTFDCRISNVVSASNRIYDDYGVDVNPNSFNSSFVPWGRYSIGVEFVDIYGRTAPVSNVVERYAPFWSPGGTGMDTALTYPASGSGSSPTIFDDKGVEGRTQSVGVYTMSGDLPTWVDRINIVRSRCKNIVQINQSVGFMYLWYRNQDGGDELIEFVNYGLNPEWVQAYGTDPSVNQDIYTLSPGKTFMGYVMKFNSGEPIINKDNQYIYIKNRYSINNRIVYIQNDIYSDTYLFKFKVVNVVGNAVYFSRMKTPEIHPNFQNVLGLAYTNDPVLTPLTFPVAEFFPDTSYNNANQIQKYSQLFYNFVITTEVDADDATLYTTQKTFTRDEYNALRDQYNGVAFGVVEGDASFCLAVKTFVANKVSVVTLNPGIPPTQATSPKNPKQEFQDQTLPTKGYYGLFISMNPVDIYTSDWNQNIGQVNTTDVKQARIRRIENAICFSNPFVQGSQVNGLNKFNSVDFRLAPVENGPITAIVTTNATQREPGVLLAIGTFGVSSFYYDGIQLNNVDGSSNVTTTDAYLASQRPLLGQYGTSRPMSVTKTPLGTVYWWSDVVNDMIRYTNAGLERLGNTFSFANYLRNKYNGNPLLITWYDQVTDEINLLGRNQNTAVFSERYKTFQGEREYWQAGRGGAIYPERAIGIPTKQYWFINGRIYVSDVSQNQVTVPANFLFGAFKDPKVSLVTNETPSVVKRWNQVKVLGNRPTEVILTAPIDNGGELTSVIFSNFFINRKGDWEAAIRRAQNTTGGLLGGKLMESRIIYSNFAFSAEGFDKLNFIEVKSNVSIVQ